MSEVIASCGAGVMPQTAQVRPLTDAVADICGTLEHVVPPALAAAARLRRCVTHEAAIRPPPGLTAGSAEDADEGVKQKQKQKATTSGKGGNGVASDDKVAALVSECFGAVERLNAAGRIAGEWGAFGVEGALESAPFVSPVQNFYMTDPISRASPTMAKCTAEFGAAADKQAEAHG